MSCFLRVIFFSIVVAVVVSPATPRAQLVSNFYATSCPAVRSTVQAALETALVSDDRLPAKILRVHFHDCFVNGCDGSVLLDSSENFISEKAAGASQSLAGFEAVDKVKAQVEKICPGVVSCADILALSSQILLNLTGGPSWRVLLGRRDSKTAFVSLVNGSVPSPFDTLDRLKQKFQAVGLDTTDLVSLSGAHSIGLGRCSSFRFRLYNFSNSSPDPTLDPIYLQTLRKICPPGGNGNVTTYLDPATPAILDNFYFKNLEHHRGLLKSDQELFSDIGADTAAIVSSFASSSGAFLTAFADSMVNMGNIRPTTGTDGEVRASCRFVNPS